MIQTLGDVLLLVTIISVGMVSFLFAIFLYHLVFVVMDLRKVMKRVNDITAELEDMLLKPVEAASLAMGWMQKIIWDLVTNDKHKKSEKVKKAKQHKKEKKKKPKSKKEKKKEFKRKKV